MRGCVRVCAGLHGYGASVHGYELVCACVLDEFSEFLPENRVLTSADFNTYPIRILKSSFHREVSCSVFGSFIYYLDSKLLKNCLTETKVLQGS